MTVQPAMEWIPIKTKKIKTSRKKVEAYTSFPQ